MRTSTYHPRLAATRRLTPIEGTAYHEAGHAVACALLRRRFCYVTIIPDEGAGSLGHIRYCKALTPDELETFGDNKRRRVIEDALLCTAAGEPAERKATGRFSVYGPRGDIGQGYDLATLVCDSSHEEANAYLNWLWERSRNFITHPAHWPLVEAVAVALVREKKLSRRKVGAIMRAAMAESGYWIRV